MVLKASPLKSQKIGRLYTATSREIHQSVTDKGNCIFIQFDIEEFYPSITKHLQVKAIEYAKLYTSITQQELDVTLHARKSLLLSKNKPWEKTINEPLFEIAMGSYDGAEI